jgi:hypothetical protein
MSSYSDIGHALERDDAPRQPRITIVEWIRQRLAARRRRKALARQMAYVLALEPHVLNDIGVKIIYHADGARSIVPLEKPSQALMHGMGYLALPFTMRG